MFINNKMKKQDVIEIAKRMAVLLAVSLLLLLSEVLHRKFFDIVPLGRTWEEWLYIVLFVSLFYFAKYKVTKVLVFAFFFLSFVANNIHYEVYQSWINGVNYYLAVTEVSEVTLTGMSMIGKLLPCFLWGLMDCAFFLLVLLIPRPQNIKYPISDAILLILFVFIFVRSFDTRQEHGISPKDSYGKLKSNYFSFGYFVGRVLPYKIFDLSSVKEYRHPMPKIISEPKVKHIIFIVGESETATHVSAFGYKRKTTPFFEELSKNPHAIVMPVYSGAMMTRVALPHLLNAIPYPNGTSQIMRGDTNLINLAKQQGFTTHWYTAQDKNEMNIMNLLGGKWLDVVKFPNDFGYEKRSMPDERLLEVLPKIKFNSELGGGQFVVLHQRGSHTPYGSLLTKEKSEIFGTGIVDRYDATILNTDRFIKTVLDHVKKYNIRDYLLVYTSDHGAYVTDRVYNQGTLKDDSYRVPLMIYSDNSEIIQGIKQAFEGCSIGFHQQISTILIWLLGYEIQISGCADGVVNGNLLSGDAGYLQINGKNQEYLTHN